MLRIAICDDMEEVLNWTKTLIEKWNNQTVSCHIETFSNGDDLIQAHKTSPFDILILDVVMPLFNGIETASEIRQFDQTVKIVFLTSAPEFAVESYEVKASNYLLKPVQEDKLFACLTELSQALLAKKKSILVRCFSTTYRVELENLDYIEAQNKNVQFYLRDGRVLTSIHPLYTYEDILSLEDGFFRCHRSYIINMQRVDTFTQKEVHMRGGATIPISRKYQKDFESAYFDVLFGKVGEK